MITGVFIVTNSFLAGSKPIKLVLFTSKTGNLANTVAEYFKPLNVTLVSPTIDDTDIYTYNFLSHFPDFTTLIGMSVGYTKLIPESIIDLFNGRLFNIHPGELPLTKGLYGKRVIEKMITNYRTQGCVTIHRINERYDEGEILNVTKFLYLPHHVLDLMDMYADDNDEIPLRHLNRWVDYYTQPLKLIEPTITVNFLKRQIAQLTFS